MLGHDVKNYAEHFAATKNGGMVDYQYGDFLKAMGGRARSGPVERKAGAAEYSPEGGGETSGAGRYSSKGDPIRCEEALQHSRAEAADDGQCRNPRDEDEVHSGFAGITAHGQGGNHAHAGVVVSSTADVHKPVTELKEEVLKHVADLPSGLGSKAHDNKMLGLSREEMGCEKYSDGLNVSKPKSSWTRFQRMDFGLGSLQQMLVPSNGKRPMPVDFDGNQILKGDEGRTKRGELENGEASMFERSAGVDDHPCREQ